MLETAVRPWDFSCDREKTCCFTGHRKRGLPRGGDPFSAEIKALKSRLGLLICDAYEDGFRTFITGMASGIDLFAAAEVSALRKQKGFEDIRLVCAVPYPEQYREMKTAADSYIYELCLRDAAETVLICERYIKDCYSIRNHFMIDNSSRLIAVANMKSRSGSTQTVRMAEKAGLFIDMIDLSDDPYIFT